VADIASRMMPPTLTWTGASEKQPVGLYRTQRLAKSLLSYTCHDRGAETRGRNAPLGREGLLQTKAKNKEKEVKKYYNKDTLPGKKRRETLGPNYQRKS